MSSQEIEAIEFSLRFRIFDNALLLCQEYFYRNSSPKLLELFARAYLESGSPIQASILIKQYEYLIGENYDLRLLYAQCLFECGKYSQAEAILKPLDSITNLNSEIKTASIYLVGLIKLRTHRHNQAKPDFQSAYKMNPFLLTAITHSQVEVAQPQKEAKQNPQTQRRSLLPPKQLRSTYSTTGKSQPKRSHSLQPVNTPQIGQLLKGVANLPSVIKSLPNNLQDSIIPMKLLGCYHFKCSKYHEAFKVFRRLYEMHPHTIEGIDIFSTVLWQLKDERSLSNLARRAIEMAPSRPEPWIAAGNLLSLQHNTEAAIQMFQRAASIDMSHSYALALAGHEYLLLESISEASKLFRQSIDRNPLEWSAWYGLGSCHYRQDNFGAAEYYMKKALEINPASSVLNYVYAMVLRKCNRDDDALQIFDNSIKLDPYNLVSIYQKAILLDDIGDVSGAVECLKAAEALAPHEPGVSYLKGKIAQRLGSVEEATIWYTDALIYGHQEKKEIHTCIELLIDQLINNLVNKTQTETSELKIEEEEEDVFD